MSGIIEVLDGIYGLVDTSVMIYDGCYNRIWENSAASELDEELRAKISFYIMRSGQTSGKLPFGRGGRFYTITVLGEKFTAAEVNNENPLINLLSEPEIAKYLSSAEISIRRSTAGIAYSCDAIAAEDISEDVRLYLNNIIKSCLEIIKNVSLGSQISSSVFSNYKAEKICADSFFAEIADGCSRAMSGCRVNYERRSCGVIESDKTVLTCFILGVVNLLIGNGIGRECALEFKSESDDNKTILIIEAVGSCSEEKAPEMPDILDAAAELMKLEYTLAPSRAELRINKAEAADELEFGTDKLDFGDSLFSPFNIMLGDLDCFKDIF